MPHPQSLSAAPPSRRVALGFRAGRPDDVERTRERIRRILRYRSWGFSSADRADLEQEVLVQLWQAVRRPGFDAEGGFWGLVHQIAAARCVDWLRRRRPTHELDPSLAVRSRGPLDRALGSERRGQLRRALAELDDTERELVEGRLAEGHSYRDLSRRLGKSEGALRMQMLRTIKSLRERLKQSR